MRTDPTTFGARHWLTAGATVAAVLLATGVMMLWGWNTLAVELFGARQAQFRHALAAEALVLSTATLAVMAMRLSRRPQ